MLQVPNRGLHPTFNVLVVTWFSILCKYFIHWRRGEKTHNIINYTLHTSEKWKSYNFLSVVRKDICENIFFTKYMFPGLIYIK